MEFLRSEGKAKVIHTSRMNSGSRRLVFSGQTLCFLLFLYVCVSLGPGEAREKGRHDSPKPHVCFLDPPSFCSITATGNSYILLPAATRWAPTRNTRTHKVFTRVRLATHRIFQRYATPSPAQVTSFKVIGGASSFNPS